MAAIYKLLDNIDEHSYTLIAIHSTLEDYRLAYFLNKHLNIKLKREEKNIVIKNDFSFSLYEWEDVQQHITYNLIKNIAVKEENILSSSGLFQENVSFVKGYMVPEKKKVDFFLKVEEITHQQSQYIINIVSKISNVITTYSIDPNQLKSKYNLIF
ncbi:IPExxxVDY family protein [Zhouia sp. PK063]|uniref:IPExxxVDY family protein n=1 Tax=Zhouia sp. PK063 TaxID=3373602 RepID=UPI0037969436